MSNKTLISPYLISQGFGSRPDIVIATNAMQLDENAPQGVPVLSMIGSSTVKDMQRDTMQMSALQDMTEVPTDLTIWLNHSYTLPDDVFGKLHDKPSIKTLGNIADLFIRVEVETENPAASRTFNMVMRGKKFGCSVGCQVTDYEFDGLPDDLHAPILIKHVKVVEWSVVGIPANQRCWVEQALKGLFERSLLEGRADDALQLAAAYKGLYWRDYERVVRNVEHIALKKDLERVGARSTHPQFILWDAVRDLFQLNGPRDVAKSLSRAEASALLDSQTAARAELVEAYHEAGQGSLTTKSASGKADWPLGDRAAAWDGSAAHNRVVEWAKKPDGSLDQGKMKSVHFWFDDSAPENITSYKLLFCDIKGGKPVAMPRAIFACAGSHGIATADIPSGDLAAVKGRIAAYYKRMAQAFHDETIVAPWEQQQHKQLKAATKAPTDKDILDSSSGNVLNRQDLTEDPEKENKQKMTRNKADEMLNAKDVEVAEDGTHEACIGSHSHMHASYAPTTTKAAADADGEGDEEQDDKEGMHTHLHTHEGDAHHGHDHTPPTADKQDRETEKALDPAKAALLKAYNTIGQQLGFAERSLTKAAASSDVDMQSVVTLISQLDDYMDDAEDTASCIMQAGHLVDALMQAFGIPDIDDDDEDDDEDGAAMPALGMRYSLGVVIEKSLRQLSRLKEGRAISTENQQKLQMIHECVKAMHPDCCKADGTGQQDSSISVDEARRDANFQMGNMAASWMPDLINGMQTLSQALSGANISGMQLEINNVTKTLQSVQKQLRSSQGDLASLQTTLNALKNVPLGRPTHLNRTVEGEATYEDMLAAGQQQGNAQKGLFAQTTLVQKNGFTMRHWGAGIGAGQRPPLSGDEMSLMYPSHISAYYDGLEVDVPMIDMTPPTA